MESIVVSTSSGYDLLRKSELHLRAIVDRYLRQLCSRPYDVDESGHERWEEIHFDRIFQFMDEGDQKRFKQNLDEMYDIRCKRLNNDCKPTFDRSLINMLSSSTLGQLWHVFIKWSWKGFFDEILDPLHKYRSKNDWKSSVFDPLLEWRNAANHYNDEELSDETLSKANDIASSLCRDIERWLSNNYRS